MFAIRRRMLATIRQGNVIATTTTTTAAAAAAIYRRQVLAVRKAGGFPAIPTTRSMATLSSTSGKTITSSPAVKNDSNRTANAQSLVDRAGKELESGDIDKALASYRQSIELNPTGTAHYNLGNIYFQLGDMELAKENWLKSVDLEKGQHADVFVNLGNMELMFNNQPRQALEYYQRAEQLEPDDGEIAFNMAVAYDKSDDWDKAVETYRRAKQLLTTAERSDESVEKRLQLIEPMLRNALTKAMASRNVTDNTVVDKQAAVGS